MMPDAACAVTVAQCHANFHIHTGNLCSQVAALVDQFYAEVQKMGGSRWDTSSLIRRLR